MFSEYDVVRLKRAKASVPAGTTGAVMMVYDSTPQAYEVEFVDSDGVTLGVLTAQEDDLEPAAEPQATN